TADGDLVLLEDQDRSLWKRDMIEEGLRLVDEALQHGEIGPFTLQASIAAEHAKADRPETTDWNRIAALYDLLLRVMPSPVIELNRAVALAMRDGPAEGLVLVDDILDRGELNDYHLAHAARADLCRRRGRLDEARVSYERAREPTSQEPERRFVVRRLRELEDSG